MIKNLLFISAMIASAAINSQVCEPNGVSTNPDNPTNPDAPTNHPEHWLNDFKWYDHDGPELLPYAIYNMLSYSSTQYSMTHPYSNDVDNGYSELTSPEYHDLDMYPDQGWELISVNLGAYPNGELLSDENPPLQSGFGEVPYLLLYNKNRASFVFLRIHLRESIVDLSLSLSNLVF